MDDENVQRLDARLNIHHQVLTRHVQSLRQTITELTNALNQTTALAERQQQDNRVLLNGLARSEVDRRAHLAFITGGSNYREIFDAGRRDFYRLNPRIYLAEQWQQPAWMEEIRPATGRTTAQKGQA